MSKPIEHSTDAELNAEIERLRSENEALRARQSFGGGLRVSAKGAVSVYGINSVPVTLYKEPMLRLLDLSDKIREFIKANDSVLASKPEGFMSMRDEAKAKGLTSVASVMLERQALNTSELKSGLPKPQKPTQTSLPGLAATRVVQKAKSK